MDVCEKVRSFLKTLSYRKKDDIPPMRHRRNGLQARKHKLLRTLKKRFCRHVFLQRSKLKSNFSVRGPNEKNQALKASQSNLIHQCFCFLAGIANLSKIVCEEFFKLLVCHASSGLSR